MLTPLQTEAGDAYVDLEHVMSISAQFQKKGHLPARTLCLRGGHRIYILDNEANMQTLLILLPRDVQERITAALAASRAKAAAIVSEPKPKRRRVKGAS